MKWIKSLLGRKPQSDERLQDCARNLTRLLGIIPWDEKESAVNALKTFMEGAVLNKTDDIISFDATGMDVQQSMLFYSSDIKLIYDTFSDTKNAHFAITLTMEAERNFVLNIFKRLKQYCTLIDNIGGDMIMFTGGDISCIWSCLDIAQSFLAYRSITNIDDSHKEVIEFMDAIRDFSMHDDAVVLMSEKIMLSDPALDAVIYEMGRHYFVLGFGELVEKYGNANIKYVEDFEGESKTIGITEG
jgi:hypothetical protein